MRVLILDLRPGLEASLWSTGKTKAAVLPVPVCAQAIKSLLSNIKGMACCWTGVGSIKPIALSASSKEDTNEKSLNDKFVLFSEVLIGISMLSYVFLHKKEFRS